LSLLDDLGDAKVADLDSLFAVKEDVIELDVSVDHRPAVDVGQAVDDLLEDELRIRLLQLPFPLDQPQQVSASRILHDHEQVLAALEHFKQPDDVGVLDLLEEVDLLEDLPLGEVILHVGLLDGLYRHILPRQLMDP